MTDSSKRVFISYRRSVAQHLSLLLFFKLKERGYDVFRDYSSVGPGDFERVILSQIAARDHFLLLLVPETLDRCNYDEKTEYPKAPNHDDWLRKEIEHAIATGRNIIPLVVDGYEWHMIEPKLTAGLEPLKKINSLNLITTHDRLFDVSLDVLCDEYLVRPTSEATVEPEPEAVKEAEEIIKTSATETIDEKAVEAELCFSEGNIARENKDFETAIKKFNKVIELQQEWHLPYIKRGLTYYDLERYEEAINDFNHAIHINSNDIYAFNGRGLINAFLGHYAEAIDDFNQAIHISSNEAMTYSNRGFTYNRFGRYEEAITDLNQAIHINPKDSNAYFDRGNAYSGLERYEDALADYNQAIVLDPDNADTYFNRGYTNLTLGRYEDALRDYDQVIALDPDSAEAYSNRGIINSMLLRLDQAIADLKKALSLDPSDENANGAIEATRNLIASLKDAAD